MKMHTRTIAVGIFLVAVAALTPCVSRADGAVVIRDDGCAMVDQAGNVSLFSQDNIRVETFSKNCNSTVQCKTEGVTNSSGKAVHLDYDSTGLPCDTGFGLTTQWHEIISPSGVASLVCHVNTCPI